MHSRGNDMNPQTTFRHPNSSSLHLPSDSNATSGTEWQMRPPVPPSSSGNNSAYHDIAAENLRLRAALAHQQNLFAAAISQGSSQNLSPPSMQAQSLISPPTQQPPHYLSSVLPFQHSVSAPFGRDIYGRVLEQSFNIPPNITQPPPVPVTNPPLVYNAALASNSVGFQSQNSNNRQFHVLNNPSMIAGDDIESDELHSDDDNQISPHVTQTAVAPIPTMTNSSAILPSVSRSESRRLNRNSRRRTSRLDISNPSSDLPTQSIVEERSEDDEESESGGEELYAQFLAFLAAEDLGDGTDAVEGDSDEEEYQPSDHESEDDDDESDDGSSVQDEHESDADQMNTQRRRHHYNSTSAMPPGLNPSVQNGELTSPFNDDDDHGGWAVAAEESARVRRKELRELLSDTWLTITGAPMQPSSTNQPVQYTGIENSQEEFSTDHDNVDGDEIAPANRLSSAVHRFIRAGSQNRYPVDGDVPDGDNMQSSTGHPSSSGTGTENSVPLFSSAEALIDDLPIAAIRRLVARQTALALQLLLQISVVSHEDSELATETNAYLQDWAALRSTAVRRSTLLQVQMASLSALRRRDADASSMTMGRSNRVMAIAEEADPLLARHFQRRRIDPSSIPQYNSVMGSSPSSQVEPTLGYYDGMIQDDRRLTRSWLASTPARRTPSLFDVPLLRQMGNLTNWVTHTRQRLQHLANETHHIVSRRLGQSASTPIGALHLRLARSEAMFESVSHFLRELPSIIGDDVRVWNCLIPISSYPFNNPSVSATSSINLRPCGSDGRPIGKFSPPEYDSALNWSLSQYGGISNSSEKNHTDVLTLVPAEEDLLMRGVFDCFMRVGKLRGRSVAYGDLCDEGGTVTGENLIDWRDISNRYLPNIPPPILAAVFYARVSGSEYSQWKRLLELLQRPRRTRDLDRWALTEDLALLRAFAMFGRRWPLVRIHMLPRRKVTEIRFRWSSIQSLWRKARLTFERTRDDLGAAPPPPPSFSPAARTLLAALLECFTLRAVDFVAKQPLYVAAPLQEEENNTSIPQFDRQIVTDYEADELPDSDVECGSLHSEQSRSSYVYRNY